MPPEIAMENALLKEQCKFLIKISRKQREALQEIADCTEYPTCDIAKEALKVNFNREIEETEVKK